MAKLTRRNTIIGLGALVGGAGALAASGAFTAVEAQRTVDVETTGDADALLALEPGQDATLVNDEDETISIELDDDGINLRARSQFDYELLITNNGDNDVDIDILSDFADEGGRSLIETDQSFISFEVNGEGDHSTHETVTSGNSIGFDIEINFLDSHVEGVSDANYSTSFSSPVNTTNVANDLLNEDLGDGEDYIVIEANDAS